MKPKVVIVGAGLSGLFAATLLEKRGIPCRIIEARNRIGGRVMTTNVPGNGAFDLGPTWFWPHFESEMMALTRELGLPTFPQHTEGAMLFEQSPHVAASRHLVPESPESRSLRIAGGVERLIESLAATLTKTSIELGKSVIAIHQQDTGCIVDVTTTSGSKEQIQTSHVILAIPPRVVLRDIKFQPELPSETRDNLASKATWMAGQAKLIAVYDRSFWREQGLSGFVSSRVGPMQEIHDASPDSGSGALFGFFGLPAQLRQQLGEDEVKRLAIEQLTRLFGEQAAKPVQVLYKDWSTETVTATPEDLEPLRDFPPYGFPPLSGSWTTTLAFAGTESSNAFGGHLEGALWSARAACDLVSSSTGNN